MTSKVQTTLAHVHSPSEAAQRQISGSLGGRPYVPRDVQAIGQQARADVAALRSEVRQLRKAIDAANRPGKQAMKHPHEAAQKQLPRPPARLADRL
jgi:hypothetical protein